MNHVLIIVTVVAFVMLSSCYRATSQPQRTRSAFAAQVESVLPTDWSLEENGEEITISRKNPITQFPCVAMDVAVLRSPEALKHYIEVNGISNTYQIRLRRAAFVDVSEYQRVKAVNDQIVVTKSTPVPDRKFLEDDALRSFDSRYRELPEYYDDSSSIYLETNLGPYECIHPNPVARECEGVRQQLDSLFHRYSSENRRGLGLGVD